MGTGAELDTNKHRIKILVVDDDELNRRMMKVLLAREGYEVDLASNGLEAIDAVKYQHYDIVFMDLQMPLMDGVESSRRIREWENGGSHTFIVALTASYLPEEGHILYEAGIDNYISKPFEIEHIQRMLKYISDAKNEAPATAKPTSASAVVATDQTLDTRLGMQRVGGDQDIYRELLGDFISELPAKLENIQLQYSKRDMTSLSRAAHNLKGVAANLGATELSEGAGKLDKHCNDGYTESMQGLVLDVTNMGSRLQEAARNFLASTSSVEGLRQI